MSDERDQLARDIPTWTNLPFGGLGHVKLDANAAYAIAGVLIEKGYRKPQQVTTVRELHALPADTVIRSVFGAVFVKDGGWWAETGARDKSLSADLDLPATVLHVGAAA